MGKRCMYCHENWEKRLPIKDTKKEYVILGVTNKIEIEIKESKGNGLTVFTSLETRTCPKCSRWLECTEDLDKVKNTWGDLYLREDISRIVKSIL